MNSDDASMDNSTQEYTVWTGQPSLWTWWRELALAGILTLAGLYLVWLGKPWARAIGVLAACLIAKAILQSASKTYIVTNQRVIAHNGLFSKRVTEVELRDIRNMNLQQSFSQRLRGIGDIEISSAGHAEVEVLLAGIARPEVVKEKIRTARLKN